MKTFLEYVHGYNTFATNWLSILCHRHFLRLFATYQIQSYTVWLVHTSQFSITQPLYDIMCYTQIMLCKPKFWSSHSDALAYCTFKTESLILQAESFTQNICTLCAWHNIQICIVKLQRWKWPADKFLKHYLLQDTNLVFYSADLLL